MDLKKLIKTKDFIEKMSKSIELIIWKNFPQLSRQEREDVEQEVKLKIWRMIARGKKIKNLRSYLWRVVYTTTLDMIDERMNNLPFDSVMEEQGANPISRLDIRFSESLMERKEWESMFERALHSLVQNRSNHLYYRGLSDLKKQLKDIKN